MGRKDYLQAIIFRRGGRHVYPRDYFPRIPRHLLWTHLLSPPSWEFWLLLPLSRGIPSRSPDVSLLTSPGHSELKKSGVEKSPVSFLEMELQLDCLGTALLLQTVAQLSAFLR